MEFSRKTILQLTACTITVISLAFVLNSCTSKEATSPLPSTPEENSFLAKKTITAAHIIGVSSCPEVIDNIAVFCGRNRDSCTADSVVLTNSHPGLSASFTNGKLSSSFSSDPILNNILQIRFTCQVAMSFSHKYKLEFYKNGTKVDEQELTVNMTVE